MMQRIPAGEFLLAGQPVDLHVVKISSSEPPLVRVELSSPQRLDESHVDALKQMIVDQMGQAVILEAQLNLKR